MFRRSLLYMTPLVELSVLCSETVTSIFVISFSFSSFVACNAFFVLIKSSPSFVFLHDSTSPSCILARLCLCCWI